MTYKIKVIVGFRRDQEHSIDAEEAHKAYHLFLNPDARTIFSNGLALRGDQIQEIVPDYQGTMGWNPTHILGDDDWAELREKGIVSALQNKITQAKEIAQIGDTSDMNVPLSALVEKKYLQLSTPSKREGNFKNIKDLLLK
jgi:hypothetical protein